MVILPFGEGIDLAMMYLHELPLEPLGPFDAINSVKLNNYLVFMLFAAINGHRPPVNVDRGRGGKALREIGSNFYLNLAPGAPVGHNITDSDELCFQWFHCSNGPVFTESPG